MRPNRLVLLVVILTLATLAPPAGGQTPQGDVVALLRAIDETAGRAGTRNGRDVATIRHEREALLTADDRAFETGLEMMEGTANYVARVVVGLKPAETATRLRAQRPADIGAKDSSASKPRGCESR